jgi:predicted nucleic acid-binding protein
MIDGLSVDANSVIELIRKGSSSTAAFPRSRTIFLPLPALGELLTGAYSSHQVEENLSALNKLMAAWTVLSPNAETAHVYGRVRTAVRDMPLST